MELDAARRCARIVTEGAFDPEAHGELIEDLIASPFFRPGMPALFDNRGLDLSDTSFDDLQRVGRTHLRNSDRLGGGRVAVLMGSAAGFARARQVEMLIEGKADFPFQVFLDPTAASAWVSHSALVW